MTILPHWAPTGVAGAITGDELHLAALSSGDRHNLAGPVLRAATVVADVQPDPRYSNVGEAVAYLAGADDIDQAMRDLITSRHTTKAVRRLIGGILLAADEAAGWSK